MRSTLLGQGMRQYRTPATSYEFRVGTWGHLIDPRRRKSRWIPSRGRHIIYTYNSKNL